MAATARTVDLTNVKDQGNFSPRHVEEGDYRMKVAKVDDHTSNSGGEGWVFTLKREGDERATYPYYVGADTKQAWKVRKLMLAAGFKAPKSKVKFDPNRMVGKMIGAYLEDDEYEGRVRSKVGDIFPASDIHDETEETESAPEEVIEDVVEDDDNYDSDQDSSDDDETPEEDPEPEPAPKKTAAKRVPPKKAAPEPVDEDLNEMNLDDLDDM